MISWKRIWILVPLGAAILAILLLASGLSQMELQTGNLFTRETLDQLRILITQFGIFRGWLVVLFLLAPVLLLWVVRRIRKPVPMEPVPRRRRPWVVMLIQAFMWAIAILIIRSRLAEGTLFLNPQEQGPLMPEISPAGSQGIISVDVPGWVSYLASMLLLLLAALVTWLIWRRRQRSAVTLEVIAQEARYALDELRAGEDLGDVILKCYYEMARALDYQRGIQRKTGMTPREFEQRLVSLGLPGAPVGQLTRLFEAVRYGSKHPGPAAERQAVACLDAIVRASGETS